MTDQELREARIRHDAINGKPMGSLRPEETNRMVFLRKLLHGTAYEPWGEHQTKEAYESIYGPGSWEGGAPG